MTGREHRPHFKPQPLTCGARAHPTGGWGQIRSGEPGDVNAVGKDILFLLSAHVLRPGTKAALFEAAATMSGLTVVPDVNVAGRSGVGIAWSYDGKTGMIIFDSTTYDYLGVQAGDGQSMVLDVAIVDEAGRRP